MSAVPGRPRRLVVVAGTGTEIGKTWVGAAVLGALRSDGWVVAARKPAQSNTPGEPTDADLLAAASGEAPERVCPPHRSYKVPMAPPMAAEALGLEPPTIADLVGEVAGSWGGRAADVGLVELAGGVASPAATDGDGAALTAGVEPDAVVLVADAGLGTINSVRLSLDRLRTAGVGGPVVVFLNRYDSSVELHRRNRSWLAERDGFEVLTDLEPLAERIVELAEDFCGSCGLVLSQCLGDCARPLDPDRYCTRCGRTLVVSISPAGHSARCKVHGAT